MTPTCERVWRALATRPWGSLGTLLESCALDPAGLGAALQELERAGVAVQWDAHSYACAGTSMPQPLHAPQRPWLQHSECVFALDSTQRRASECSKAGPANGLVLAETQSAGRGRDGRSWSSPLGAHLYLSLWWTFSRPLRQMAGLSLLVGIALRRSLHALGVLVGLKWPNDLYWHGRKLGGVLVELSDRPQGCVAVIGIGLNHHMPLALAPESPWVDLQLAGFAAPSRQQVLETLLDTLQPLLVQFEQHGFAPFVDEFDRHHVLLGQQLQLAAAGPMARIAGVSAEGQLQLDDSSGAAAPTLLNAGELRVPAGVLQQPWRLLLDCGNTRLKWAWSPLAQPALLLQGAPVPLKDAAGQPHTMQTLVALLRSALRAMAIDGDPAAIVLASSYGGDRPAMRQALADALGASVHEPESPDRHGRWRNAYAQPATLGIDRALAMWAVLPQLQPAGRVLLVSVGTALTLDVLDGQGQHHGGLIAAAPALQRSALAQLSVRLIPSASRDTALAANSADAVAHASVRMAVALIEEVAHTHLVDALWLSGGALLEVLPQLRGTVPVRVGTDLVLRGLALL